jgi:GH24 family phage-related lysozyme (muramidase)
VLTIGYGSTGPHVTAGKTISQAEANDILAGDLERFEIGVDRLVKVPISQGIRDALISFAFNLGVGALEESTLLRRLNGGEEQCKVVREELPKWCKAGSQVLEGLKKRRAAEIELACPGSAPAKASTSNPLKVQYQSQNDNKSGTGYRECFSSSCAMLAMYWGKVANDDQYNLVRAKYGDSTSAEAQLAALRHLGLKADFHTDGNAASLEAELNAGRPVAVGWLHHGSRNNPTGGGHWSVVTNHSPTSWIQNDPNGEADLVNGGYYTPNLNGAGVVYSRGNWNPRWMVGGSGGWYLRCRP